ncbi:formate dehydrogenase accessory sulfurtransferase FdhD [Putridiphycobacter roseus]|uniref:Sulfur carrier protein FdhD n=1 Tax=Putridiphycobacter roseus TaxID=2219161 RepID=A0A2W1MVB7_9FLAO|nr:formate dehydrogenase accessory sulfurtransferase FdhD [Putridiphycobacter roseus]PZE16039.1 formate dehydrogenase accessory sulfurtransferase FdhD [Putridiphycobacter roseus]
MEAGLKYQGIRIEKTGPKKVEDIVTVEKPLQISINGDAFTVVMQTPGEEVELALGLLYAEDVIKKNTPHQLTIHKDEENTVIEIDLEIEKQLLGKGYLSSRSLLSVSSCGICGKQSISDLGASGERLSSTEKLTAPFIFDLQNKMHAAQKIFPQTGSIHGAALFDVHGNLLACKEDIGRHNALDKSVGALILQGNLDMAKTLFFSGRISYEIVIKSFRAKIHTIIAISGPSSLALDYAKEFGIHIIGFCRENRFTIYTDPTFFE